jgi:CRP-like cAMP-binding protein
MMEKDGSLDGKNKVFHEVATLHTGQSFGDLCLLEDKTRAATIISKQKTRLLVLHKEEFTKILGRVQSDRLNEKINFFNDISLFHGWSRLALSRLCYHF